MQLQINCPACHCHLARTKYEGFPVFRCSGCRGYLVASPRVKDIQRRQAKRSKELIAEAAQASNDIAYTLYCPRCHVAMRKHPLKDSHEFCIDECSYCEVIWFDAGELAILQLEHDAKPGQQSNAAFQQRIEQMTPAEIAEFEANLAKLDPGAHDSFLEAIKHGILTGLNGGGLFRSFRQLDDDLK